jgi:hypothetical protein
LPGALGRPGRTLLPAAPEWRWMLERADMPWYGSVRLFRQPQVGDWESVFADVAGPLAGQVSLSLCGPSSIVAGCMSPHQCPLRHLAVDRSRGQPDVRPIWDRFLTILILHRASVGTPVGPHEELSMDLYAAILAFLISGFITRSGIRTPRLGGSSAKSNNCAYPGSTHNLPTGFPIEAWRLRRLGERMRHARGS